MASIDDPGDSGVYLFHVSSFNDIDHIAPVMYKFLECGETVHCVGLTGYNFEEDYRIRLLQAYPKFEFSRASSHDKIRHNILYGRLVQHLKSRVFGERVFSLFSWVASRLWRNKFLSGCCVKAAIYEWRGLGQLNFYDAKTNGVPVIALPHGGPFTFLNDDFTAGIREQLSAGKAGPDFSSRNQFDSFVVMSNLHAEWVKSHGIEPEKLTVLGSARFSHEWSGINLSKCGSFVPQKNDEQKCRVAFFVPHWTYNAYEERVVDLLKALAARQNVYLVIKGHTRGTGSVNDDVGSELENSGNVEVNVVAHSPAIIKWCDVVINVSSSIAFEAINQGKPVIHAQYLHDNATIFDSGEVAYVAKDKKSLMSLLVQAKNHELRSIPQDLKTQFMDCHVGGGANGDVLGNYLNHIKSVSTNGMLP